MLNRVLLLVKPARLNKRSVCWASFDCNGCQNKIKNPECKACEKMINYFNVFSIPQNYQIDQQQITLKARQLQKQFHPDTNFDNTQNSKFVEYSAYINHAKSTLTDDLKRAVYLMELKGINIDDDSKIEDNAFMMDIFQLQEEIENATPEQASKINSRIQNILANLKQNLALFFQSEDIDKCKQFVYKYKYMDRAMENSRKKMEGPTHH